MMQKELKINCNPFHETSVRGALITMPEETFNDKDLETRRQKLNKPSLRLDEAREQADENAKQQYSQKYINEKMHQMC